MVVDRQAHRNAPLQPVGSLLQGADFVWAAKARAEAARAAAEQNAPQPKPQPARSAEAEAMVLALLEKYGSAPDEAAQPAGRPAVASVAVRDVVRHRTPAPKPAPASVRANPVPKPPDVAPARSSSFDQADDGKPADATWLHMELARVPTLYRAGFRGAREASHTRGAWRRALAAVMQRSPAQLASPGGALVMQVRKATALGTDPRTCETYCAAPGWGPEAYRFAGVEGYIHVDGNCRCT